MVKPDTIRFIAANLRLSAELLDKVAGVSDDTVRVESLARIMRTTGDACATTYTMLQSGIGRCCEA